jgi:N-acetylglucosaminyl-diphospho-decaprenol L-rhamnosyltransferase
MLSVPSPHLAVIIVTYNSAHVIAGLLDSIPAALGGLSADVVVVDNGSSDGTASIVEARGDCRLIRSTNIGYAGGINRGVAEAAPAAAILILNPDVILRKNSVPPLLDALAMPNVGIAVPQVRSAQNILELSLRREPTLLRALGLNRTGSARFSEYISSPMDYLSPCTVDWALGAILMVSRACYDTVEGLDESYFLYSEETDLSLRARDLGILTHYVPSSIAVHIGGQSGRTGRTHVMQIVNRVRLYRRRNSAPASWLFFCLTIISEATWVLRGHGRSREAIAALLRPSRRPAELGCSNSVMPH